jgi:hypothetical protein
MKRSFSWRCGRWRDGEDQTRLYRFGRSGRHHRRDHPGGGGRHLRGDECDPDAELRGGGQGRLDQERYHHLGRRDLFPGGRTAQHSGLSDPGGLYGIFVDHPAGRDSLDRHPFCHNRKKGGCQTDPAADVRHGDGEDRQARRLQYLHAGSAVGPQRYPETGVGDGGDQDPSSRRFCGDEQPGPRPWPGPGGEPIKKELWIPARTSPFPRCVHYRQSREPEKHSRHGAVRICFKDVVRS